MKSKYPLVLYETAREITDRTIVISGPARSGTRILGSLFQSLETVEYTFEPLMLYSLIPIIDQMPKAQWCYLFETFMVEEFLLNAMAGRNINLNEHDYSHILKSKSRAEIEARMSRTHTRLDDLAEAPNRRIVAKIPDLTIWLEKMMNYYPRMTAIIMLRKPESVIGSFTRKGWLSDEKLKGPINYPPYRRYGDWYLSYMIAEEDVEDFVQMDPVSRSAYYYIRSYEGIPGDGNVIIIDYDDFVLHPRDIFNGLRERLGLASGPLTEQVIGMVREPEKDRNFSWDGVPENLKTRVFEIADKLRQRVTRF